MRTLIGCHLCPVKLIMSNKKNFSLFLLKFFFAKLFKYYTFHNSHLMYVKKFPYEKQWLIYNSLADLHHTGGKIRKIIIIKYKYSYIPLICRIFSHMQNLQSNEKSRNSMLTVWLSVSMDSMDSESDSIKSFSSGFAKLELSVVACWFWGWVAACWDRRLYRRSCSRLRRMIRNLLCSSGQTFFHR